MLDPRNDNHEKCRIMKIHVKIVSLFLVPKLSLSHAALTDAGLVSLSYLSMNLTLNLIYFLYKQTTPVIMDE